MMDDSLIVITIIIIIIFLVFDSCNPIIKQINENFSKYETSKTTQIKKEIEFIQSLGVTILSTFIQNFQK